MRAIDTNVLVRLMSRDHRAQVAVAEEFVRPGAWVSHLVLVEAVWVLSSVYQVEAKRIGAAVQMLLEHEQLAIQEADVVAAALARFRRRPAVGFSDCLILETARKAGHGPLGTFDRKLAKLEGAQRL